ncbi:carboxypeptidase-like regulatory domain-containing protein [Niabella ginsengisoli]|uniref:Carboxypeptidase-like regulatory domain-containing protein n=1 Tax=Niabella ginsengisoli TaxID=522298 RepID=A0ABS9SK71_9BACT|nr:carboxypeptidase-like regulatory domain-containing protein [Niabella ginsengisoli]MCH5598579.1 carboxypeptidase-like regulatory domain-containing protein [Niabella ginsengisoli]
MYAQTSSTASGVIKNNSGAPISNITITEKGTSNVTMSSQDGAFSLAVNNNAVLVISGVGYVQQEISVTGMKDIEVILEQSTDELSEIVVTALNISKEKRLCLMLLQNLKLIKLPKQVPTTSLLPYKAK